MVCDGTTVTGRLGKQKTLLMHEIMRTGGTLAFENRYRS